MWPAISHQKQSNDIVAGKNENFKNHRSGK